MTLCHFFCLSPGIELGFDCVCVSVSAEEVKNLTVTQPINHKTFTL